MINKPPSKEGKGKAASLTSEPIYVAEWPRNTREVIRVTVEIYQGQPVFSVRIWYRTPEGSLRPGKDGITLGVKHLAPLLDNLVVSYALTCAAGLITPDNDNSA